MFGGEANEDAVQKSPVKVPKMLGAHVTVSPDLIDAGPQPMSTIVGATGGGGAAGCGGAGAGCGLGVGAGGGGAQTSDVVGAGGGHWMQAPLVATVVPS